ncbi:MAG: recombinase family protein, partial [Hungatella sp.]
QRYVGDAVYGKVAPQKVGSKKDVHVPREDWIVVSDAHPSIVEREKFEMVQAGKKKHDYKRMGEEKALAKKVLCRACNHALKRICKGKQVYFQCTTYRNTDAYPCFKGNIPESALETAILTYLQTMAHSVQDHCNEVEKPKQSLSISIFKERKAVEDKIECKKRNLLAWYQSFKAGNMGEAVYTKQSVVIEMEIAMLQEQVGQYEQPPIVSADMERLQDYAPFNNLTKEIVDEFVKAVYMETDGSISVSWSFSDPFLSDRG